MAMDSNKPISRVHNGNDGIWDGAGWGMLAGAGATGIAYGAGVHAAPRMAQAMENNVINGGIRDMKRNNARIDKGKPFRSPEMLSNRNNRRIAQAGLGIKTMNNIHGAGKFGFGSAKSAMITGSAGLLGGALVGGIVDHLNE